MFPKGLIVSSQALAGNPMLDTEKLVSMAHAAALGGAAAMRVNGPEVVRALRSRVDIPIIGINKVKDETGRTVITPTFALAKEVADAGADIIALDATAYPSSIKEDTKELVARIHKELNCLVMADISTADEAQQAVDFVACAVKNGLVPIINVATQNGVGFYSPRWFMEEYRENGEGVVDSLGNSVLKSEYVIPCIDDPFYQQYATRYLTEVAKHFAGDDRIGGFVLWGEPTLHGPLANGEMICYCSHTREKFRQYLKNKYKTVDALNREVVLPLLLKN